MGSEAVKAITRRRFWLMWLGFGLAVIGWYASVRWLPLEAFNRLPDPLTIVQEWFSSDPAYGLSIFTHDYYLHIAYSTWRATSAFLLAVLLGVPLGILMGWKTRIYEYTAPLLSFLRPVPPLAWVPVAILVFPSKEPAVIFVTFLVAFFATVLNTLIGVKSIDPDYFRAAACLGAQPRHILCDIIVPGALPSIFTGFQIAMGAAWFSLVAGEMIAAQYGLGFMILESYNLVQYPTIVIEMITLGIVGYASSALIRVLGIRLMRWRQQSLGLTT